MGEESAAVDTNQYDGPDEGGEQEQLEAVTVSKPEAPAKEPERELTDEERVALFTPEQQAVFNREQGRKVAALREAELKAEERERQLVEAQRRLQQYEAPVRPDIPPPPDPYEDNFAQKVAHRDAMIARAAQFDAEINWRNTQEQQRQQQAAAEERAKVAKTVETYSEVATKLGITSEELATAGAQIAPYVPDKLALRILNDASGPEITTFLAKNLVELDKVTRMSPEDGAVYLETVIKPAAKRAPPKLAPEPTEKLSGASVKEKPRGPAGVQYF